MFSSVKWIGITSLLLSSLPFFSCGFDTTGLQSQAQAQSEAIEMTLPEEEALSESIAQEIEDFAMELVLERSSS